MQVGVSTGYNLEQNMQNQQPVNAFGQPVTKFEWNISQNQYSAHLPLKNIYLKAISETK